MHLLIVEDDDRLRRLLKRLLEEQRHVVETAATGSEGYDLASTPGGGCAAAYAAGGFGRGMRASRSITSTGESWMAYLLTRPVVSCLPV